MTTQTSEEALPSLLVQAARTAAEADGVAANDPHADETTSAAAAATLLGVKQEPSHETETSAMERARAAIAAQQQQQPVADTAPTAGNAAFLASAVPAVPTRHTSSASTHVTAPAPVPTMTTTVVQSTNLPVAPPMPKSKKGAPLRRGKWTPEEEAYANRLIQEFKSGLLPLTDGTTLRTFLSKLLNCDPMRISKKFVGNKCIGKQVFRRRTADINRLTPEQIQQSRAELTELERRFLDRVAQTNRVKSSAPTGAAAPTTLSSKMFKSKEEHVTSSSIAAAAAAAQPPSPAWLQPPLGYKHGTGASMAAAALSGGSTNHRAAAAGRALLQGLTSSSSTNTRKSSAASAGLLAMADQLHRNSQSNLLNASNNALSGSAMAQIARNASAARLASMAAATGNNNSMNNLLLRGLSSQQQLASANSLSNLMMERQCSFDALMSLDFSSLQSIDNLANLIQTGGNTGSNADMKNWSAAAAAEVQPNPVNTTTTNATTTTTTTNNNTSSGSLEEARRLASAGRMESLLQLLASNKDKPTTTTNTPASGSSNSNFAMLGATAGNNASSGSLFNPNNSAASLANLLRADSSTGLTALRMQEGLDGGRNSSVDDFLSLVASGDISHHDPLLNVPMNLQRGGDTSTAAGAQLLAQQQQQAQLLAASASGNSVLANALRAGSLNNLRSAAAGRITAESTSGTNKRKLDAEAAAEEGQGPAKR